MRLLPLLFSAVLAAHLRATVTARVSVAAKGGLDEVISLLMDMLQKFSTHFEEDRTNWEAYSKLSEEQEADKTAFVNEQKNVLAATTALLNAKRDQVQKLTADLQQLGKDVATTKVSLKELAEMRQQEQQQHEKELADVIGSISAVTKALEVLAGHYAATPENVALVKRSVQMGLTALQLRAPTGVDAATEAFPRGATEFLQGANPDWIKHDGSQYASYETQAGGTNVMSMLSDLRGQLEETKTQSISRENEARRQYDETRTAKEGELHRMEKEAADKQSLKAGAEATVQECTATIDQATQDLADAQTFLQTLLADRQKFQGEFNQRNKLRQSERAATQAALDALQSISVNNGAAGKAPAPPAFVQVAATSQMKTQAKARWAAENLEAAGFNMDSPQLAMIGLALQSRQAPAEAGALGGIGATGGFSQDSMEPVKNLLSELIRRLEEEQSAETSHHDWCEEEKSTSTDAQAEREHQIHGLKEHVDQTTTTVSQRKSEVLFLQDELARVAKETEEAVAIRKQEHEVFVHAKADHDEVISALETAITALSGQYSFLQGQQSPFGSYQSGSDGAASVIEMLQDLLNRYSQVRQELVQSETDAQAAHEKLLTENEQFRVDTTQLKNDKTAERRAMLGELTNSKSELKVSLIELQQVNKYLQDLRPSCDDIRSTFEERKKRREAEIAALKEALEVISDPADALAMAPAPIA